MIEDYDISKLAKKGNPYHTISGRFACKDKPEEHHHISGWHKDNVEKSKDKNFAQVLYSGSAGIFFV